MTEYAVSRGEEHQQEEANGRTEFLSSFLLMLLGKGTAWPRVHVHTKRTMGKASFLCIRTHSTVTGISSLLLSACISVHSHPGTLCTQSDLPGLPSPLLPLLSMLVPPSTLEFLLYSRLQPTCMRENTWYLSECSIILLHVMINPFSCK